MLSVKYEENVVIRDLHLKSTLLQQQAGRAIGLIVKSRAIALSPPWEANSAGGSFAV